MISYCETHKKLVPEGWVSEAIKVPDGKGGMMPMPDICSGYGAVEYIDADGWADLDRSPCRIVEYEPKND